MAKEDKEEFVNVTEELQEKHKTFTDDEIIQLTEWKFESERLAAREQGHNEGIEKSTKEHTKKMLNENLDISLISKITGLTEEEIMKIKESN